LPLRNVYTPRSSHLVARLPPPQLRPRGQSPERLRYLHTSMAVDVSSAPTDLPSTLIATQDYKLHREGVAPPTLATGAVFKMNPQPSPPLNTYPDPIASDAQMSAGSTYFNAPRSQQQSMSQEDQNIANTLAHDMDGQIHVLSPQLANGQAPSFGLGGQDGMPQTPHQSHQSHQPPMGSSIAGQHSGVDPNQDLSYGAGGDRRKRSKVSRACDECRRKKASFQTLYPVVRH
jgi:hypothetical protein